MSLAAKYSNSSTATHISETYIGASHQSLQLIEPQDGALIDPSIEGNRLYEKPDGSIGLAEKPIGFVIGEKVVRPLIDSISQVWSSCASNMVWGVTGSALTKSPIPIVVGGLSCVEQVSAGINVHQGEIALNPGESAYFECDRKIAICKRGVAAWSKDHSCNYEGPPMKVTVIRTEHSCRPQILYDAPFSGSNQWFVGTLGTLSIEIINHTGERSVMYVHAEDSSKDGGCNIM